MRIFSLLFFCCITGFLSAQIPSNLIGANPLDLKWRQINTDKVQIIFPEGNEEQGQRVANISHYLWDHHNRSIGEKMGKITILLQNQTVIPNGFVTVGPFRSEFYLTSPQFNTATDWLDQLAIHEYQHVKQFGNSRKGITQVAKSIFGSWAWGGFTATALPRWFFEGDAVVTETALTRTGRGRQPAFTMEQRSLILDDIDFGYEKAAAGSLQDFVPDWYSLGYYMVGYGRLKYGDELWKGVVNDAVRYKGLFYPFSKSLKKKTGLGTKELYQEVRQDLEKKWVEEAAARSTTDLSIVNQKKKKTVVNYTNPRWLDDNDLVVEKRGYDQLPVYYRLSPDGTETRIINSGVILGPPETTLSEGNGRLVWAEFGFDIRRANRTFSVIRSYDISAKTKRDISNRSKYFSPDITRLGDRIVTVEVDEVGHCQLLILDPTDGNILQRIPNPDKLFLQYPRWTPDGQSIVVIGQTKERHVIYRIDPTTGSSTALTPATSDQLSHLDAGEEHIFYSASYTGVNQIFAASLADGTIYQITNDPLGAFQPAASPNGQQLAYSAFRRTGFDIVKLPLEPNTWKVFKPEQISQKLPTYSEELAKREGGTIIDAVPNQVFPTKKFSKLSGLLNLHSWLPQLDPPEVGAVLLSDNKFGTLSADIGGFYNLNEDEWSFTANARYAELFPIINLGYRLQGRSTIFTNFSPENDSLIRSVTYIEEWTENKFIGGLEIPLNFSKGNAVHRLDLVANYERFHVNPVGNLENPDLSIDTTFNVGPGNTPRFSDLYLEPLAETNLNAMDLRLRWRLFRRQALQNLAPRWGIVAEARYRSTFGNDIFSGDNFVSRGDIFLPGFNRNHAFFVNLGYQRTEQLDNYRFSDVFFYPRGYNAIPRNEVFRLGLNYSLPLAYPDLPIGPLAFVKRVKLNAFADYGSLNFDTNISSFGAELRFDVRFLRLLEIDFGVRYSYLNNRNFAPNGNQHQFDFLLISISE